MFSEDSYSTEGEDQVVTILRIKQQRSSEESLYLPS